MADIKRDYELDFDGEINQDVQEYVTLAPGDYDFTVTEVSKGRYAGNTTKVDGLPACNMVTVHCRIDTPEGAASVRNNLYLHSRTEGMLSAFFSSIGQKKKGEPLRMNWQLVTGSKGRCRITQRTYEGKTYNDIQRFLLPDEGKKAFVPGAF